MEKEIWKEIPGYEGYYSASNLGRIRRDKPFYNTPKNGIIKPFRKISPRTYLSVELNKNGIGKKYPVHQLVVFTFIGPRPTPQTDINHKDGNKYNNHLSNLSYCSKSENSFHAFKLGLKKKNNAILTEQQVIGIRKKYKKGVNSERILAREYKVSRGCIHSIILRLNWKDI